MAIARGFGPRFRPSCLRPSIVPPIRGWINSLAEIISVNTTDDHNDGSCEVDCTFREALAKASGNFEPDEIILAAGPTFTLTMGTLVVTTGNTTIKGLGKTIDGNGLPVALLADIFADPGPVEIRDLTITGAAAGFVGNILADVTLLHVVVRDNTQTDPSLNGAGVLAVRGTSVRIENSLITNNSAQRSGGGVNAFDSSITIINSTISGNRCGLSGTGEFGGGIFAGGSSVTITSSTISGNVAVDGGAGGVFVGHSSLPGSATITNSTISGNSALASGGLHSGHVPMIIESCTITDNHATDGANSRIVSTQRAGAETILRLTMDPCNPQSAYRKPRSPEREPDCPKSDANWRTNSRSYPVDRRETPIDRRPLRSAWLSAYPRHVPRGSRCGSRWGWGPIGRPVAPPRI